MIKVNENPCYLLQTDWLIHAHLFFFVVVVVFFFVFCFVFFFVFFLKYLKRKCN